MTRSDYEHAAFRRLLKAKPEQRPLIMEYLADPTKTAGDAALAIAHAEGTAERILSAHGVRTTNPPTRQAR